MFQSKQGWRCLLYIFILYRNYFVGGEDAEIYRNRKGWFSINTQVICNANLKLLDIVARWPGSAHDNTIFNNSRIRRKFEEGNFPNCILLGNGASHLIKYK